MEHRIDIVHAKRLRSDLGPRPSNVSDWIGIDSYFVGFNGQRIGEFRSPENAAARWLLANGHATAGDTLVTYRGHTPSLRGNVGSLAERGACEDLTPSPPTPAQIAFRAAGAERLRKMNAERRAKAEQRLSTPLVSPESRERLLVHSQTPRCRPTRLRQSQTPRCRGANPTQAEKAA